jgi:hypothetical protein
MSASSPFKKGIFYDRAGPPLRPTYRENSRHGSSEKPKRWNGQQLCNGQKPEHNNTWQPKHSNSQKTKRGGIAWSMIDGKREANFSELTAS